MNLESMRVIARDDCGLMPGRPVLVGVSGGPDSLCLLDGLARLGYPLIAAHFDHRLRPESKQDAEVARQEAGRQGIPFILGSQDVAAAARAGHLSLEEAARELRYRFLFAEARRQAAQAVAVGHTADDQVETVLMHLLRGSGLAGLTGMAFNSQMESWDPAIPLVRPLLPFWHAETVAYCAEHGLPAVSDASNQDRSFFRNRLRHELIPFLETYNPQVRPVLWRMTQVLAGEEAIVRAAVERAREVCQVEQKAGEVTLRRDRFESLEVGLQRGLLRRAVAALLPDLRDMDFSVVERGLRFLRSGSPGQVDLLKGLRLYAEGDRLVIAAPGDQTPPAAWPRLGSAEELPFVPPFRLELPDGWRLTGEWLDRAGRADWGARPAGAWQAWLDAEKLPGRLAVRPPRPGDRFQPLGMPGHSVKLSDFWINQKLPRRARATWPLVIAGDEIAWVPGFRMAHPFRVNENTRKVLHLHLFRVSGGE